MKKLMIGIAAAALTSLAATTPSHAQNYKYCLFEGGGIMGRDCSFSTYGQCAASASGRIADCRINPMWAFSGQDQPVRKKKRRHKH